jgi:heme exporter protein CcmD
MSYAGYVAAAFAVFAVVLAWDYVVPRMRVARTLRQARLLAARQAPRPRAPQGELKR